MFTGGRFNSSVAIPVESFTVKLTNLNCCTAFEADDDDEKYRVASGSKYRLIAKKFIAIICREKNDKKIERTIKL